MSKLAITLVVLGIAAVFLQQQTEAKPFLFLPANFFVLTTRAPTTSSSSTYTGASSTVNFQLPTDIITSKLSFITSLLSSFGKLGGGGVSGGGASVGTISGGNVGTFGGGFKYGFKGYAIATTSRPTTTTAKTTTPETVFTPESSNVVKVQTSSEKSTTTTTTTSTETTVADTTTTTTESSQIDLGAESSTATQIDTEDESTTSATANTEAESEATTTATAVTSAETDASISVSASHNIQQPYVYAQQIPINTKTKNNFDISVTTNVSPKSSITVQGTNTPSVGGAISGSLEGSVSGDYHYDGPKGATVTINANAGSVPASGPSVEITSNYDYKPPTVGVIGARKDSENEISGSNLSNMYLPPSK